MQLTDIDEFMKFPEDDVEFLSAESFVVPEVVHFLGTADRRAKHKKWLAKLKKKKSVNLDEYEMELVG